MKEPPVLMDAILPFQPAKAKEEPQPTSPPTHYEVTFRLTVAETEKLLALARFRKLTPSQCIQDFIAKCQPGGVGNPEYG